MDGIESNFVGVSVIVPTFNRMKDLHTTLASLDQQSYRNFEVIVVDDGSNDGTIEFLSNYKSDKVRCIYLPRNVGESEAINVGFRECIYPFVAVVSSDDPQREDWLSEMVDFIASNPGYIFYYPNLRIIDEDGVFIADIESLEWDRKVQMLKMICVASAGTIMNFRDFFKPAELRDKEVKFPSDLIQFLNLIKHGDGVKVPSAIGIWRDNPSSLTNQKDQVSRVIEFINVCDLWIFENSSLFQDKSEVRIAQFNVRIQAMHMLAKQSKNFQLLINILSVEALRGQILKPSFIIHAFSILVARFNRKSRQFIKSRLKRLYLFVLNKILR